MVDWDAVRKKRMTAKRGTSDNNEVLMEFAPHWRKPFKRTPSKAELREQVNRAWKNWEAKQVTPDTLLPEITQISSA
jgi:hypothetical protein